MILKHLFDVVCSVIALVALSPLLVIAALGIRISSSGPIFYRAYRVGLNGALFQMIKFRTMRVDQQAFPSAIAATNDPRVFSWGAWLRSLKIDELPQLFNILKGEMSIVGPRPEDPRIVENYYASIHLQTLTVLPGLASPGSIYNYTHGEKLLERGDPERYYIERLLPIKLALEIVYVREASFGYDCAIILRTILAIASIMLGKYNFRDPPEMKKARDFICPVKYE